MTNTIHAHSCRGTLYGVGRCIVVISFHSRDRSTQKNFQLIVITHDMEFVDVLGQAGYTEHYYKVSKEVGYVEVCGLLILCTFCYTFC